MKPNESAKFTRASNGWIVERPSLNDPHETETVVYQDWYERKGEWVSGPAVSLESALRTTFSAFCRTDTGSGLTFNVEQPRNEGYTFTKPQPKIKTSTKTKFARRKSP